MIARIKRLLKRILGYNKPNNSYKSSATYWTDHNVTNHLKFKSKKESLSFLQWRFDQYPGYEELMPCNGFDDKVVLDYGCGPGHDLVGFHEHSKPKKIIGMDVSSSSLEEARLRLQLHEAETVVDLMKIDENGIIPLPDNSVDYIHSSGVLHHLTPDLMMVVLNEFNRILKNDGFIKIMVYNSYSIWNHLYVGHLMRHTGDKFRGLELADAFRRSTDGENCPISRSYVPSDFVTICNKANFTTKYLGAGICLTELAILDKRIEAKQNRNLEEEHHNFLKSLTFNDKLYPIYQNHIAGLDAVFELKKTI